MCVVCWAESIFPLFPIIFFHSLRHLENLAMDSKNVRVDDMVHQFGIFFTLFLVDQKGKLLVIFYITNIQRKYFSCFWCKKKYIDFATISIEITL